ncbi:hydrolase [Streptomyces sp. NPDC026589]|uniref:hydrolase n=1 Tax=Streptomyces sp. NPDC026589 TaxID=3155609 RepID=UPI0033E93C23
MRSTPQREALADHLLAPGNATLVLIDYQPPQISTVRSMNTGDLVANVVALAKTAITFDLPVVLSTVNVSTGVNADTIPQLRAVLPDVPPVDRTSINAWEDEDFLAAVRGADRNKLIIGALWTEACLLFPTLDALAEGYEVYPVVDALGGTTKVAHEAALARVHQAGARLTSWNSVACELQRDWNRSSTVEGFRRNAIDHRTAWGWYLAMESGTAAGKD